MTKLTTVAVALAVASGLFLGAGTAQASNMGFKLRWDFQVQEGSRNIYFVSFPLNPGFRDVGNPAPAGDGPVCESLDPAGFEPDGEITLADVVCTLWPSLPDVESGLLSLQYIDPVSCGAEAVTVNRSIFSTTIGGGETPIEAIQGLGIRVQIDQSAFYSSNEVTLVGSHDPTWPGVTMPEPPCTRHWLNLPWHSMYRTADELLCGLEGVDWVDADANGEPDTCPAGLFDPDSTGVLVSVSSLVDDVFSARTVTLSFGTLVFGGATEPFNLAPGHAYLLGTSDGYAPQLWLSPHF